MSSKVDNNFKIMSRLYIAQTAVLSTGLYLALCGLTSNATSELAQHEAESMDKVSYVAVDEQYEPLLQDKNGNTTELISALDIDKERIADIHHRVIHGDWEIKPFIYPHDSHIDDFSEKQFGQSGTQKFTDYVKLRTVFNDALADTQTKAKLDITGQGYDYTAVLQLNPDTNDRALASAARDLILSAQNLAEDTLQKEQSTSISGTFNHDTNGNIVRTNQEDMTYDLASKKLDTLVPKRTFTP